MTIVFSLYSILMIAICLFSIATLEQYLPLYVMCLSPLVAFFVGLSELTFIENESLLNYFNFRDHVIRRRGVVWVFTRTNFCQFPEIVFTWSIFTNSQIEKYSVPFGILYIFCVLMFDVILYLFLAYLMTSINPGKFGTRKSPFFLFEVLQCIDTKYYLPFLPVRPIVIV